MSLVSTPLALGALHGTVHDFANVGDLLPMHEHTAETVHVTIVVRGSIRARGDGWEMTLKPGPVYDWKPGQRHEFEALEADSRAINIVKGGGR
jgi:quercetin dioxygenase-like cupin family protein